MAIYNIHEAKTRLSELIARVEAGEEIIIARHNVPMVKIVPVHDTLGKEKSPVAAAAGFGEGAQMGLAGMEGFHGDKAKQAAPARKPGALKGMFTLPDSFFDPLPEEELQAWEGKHSYDPDRKT